MFLEFILVKALRESRHIKLHKKDKNKNIKVQKIKHIKN